MFQKMAKYRLRVPIQLFIGCKKPCYRWGGLVTYHITRFSM
ncbi:hypothetical protein Hanom_Chr12g01090951 [Helianthus anomalus]